MPQTRKTHCVNGHPRTPDNILKGSYACRICANANSVRYSRKAAKARAVTRKKWATTKIGKRSILNSHLKVTHGITLEQQENMLKEQDGCCAICKKLLDSSSKVSTPYVDHLHEEGPRRGKHKVRGLLCHLCNVLLGAARDNVETLSNAIQYLNKFKETQCNQNLSSELSQT